MLNLQAKHYAVLGAMLVAIGTQLAGIMGGWHEVLTPVFIGGLLIQVGTTIAALFVGAPRSEATKTRSTDT